MKSIIACAVMALTTTLAGVAEQIGTPCQCIPREFLPTMTPQQMEAARSALASPFTTESERRAIIQRLLQATTPYTIVTSQGRVWIDPRTGAQMLIKKRQQSKAPAPAPPVQRAP
jgi:hypothetical protein